MVAVFIMSKKQERIKILIPEKYRGKYNGSHIRWNDHIGDNIQLVYEDGIYDVTIKSTDIKKERVLLSYKEKEVGISYVQIINKLREQEKYGDCLAGKLLYLINDDVLLGKYGYNALIHFKYKNGYHVVNDRSDYFIVNSYTKTDKFCSSRKYYLIHCNKCGAECEMTESGISSESECPCCSNRRVVNGVNDIATTDPWAVKYFKNKDDVFKYHTGSYFSADLVCPNCGKEYPSFNIRNFFGNTYGLNCPCSRSNVSYPERFIFNMFKQLSIDVVCQANRSILGWSNGFRYDFYIQDYSCIIETHGIQHYEECNITGRSLSEEIENDNQKRELAFKNGINNYIELDCRKSNKKWIKGSVMSSILPTLFNFTEKDIDWNTCDRDSVSFIKQDIAKAYDQDLRLTKNDIADMFGLKYSTVRCYLKEASRLGMCDYKADSIREKYNSGMIDSIICVYYNRMFVRAFTSCVQIHNCSKEIFGTKYSEHKIYDMIKNRRELNGYTIVRRKDINTYFKYINFMCDCSMAY